MGSGSGAQDGSGCASHAPLYGSCTKYISWQVVVSYEVRGNIRGSQSGQFCDDSGFDFGGDSALIIAP